MSERHTPSRGYMTTAEFLASIDPGGCDPNPFPTFHLFRLSLLPWRKRR